MIQNADWKISAKNLADRFWTVLTSLIIPGQGCAIKGRAIQSNIHLVHTIIEAMLINLDQPKDLDRASPHNTLRLLVCNWIHQL